MFELEINDTKTEVCEVPEIFDPEWKARLRNMQIEENDSGRSVHAIFDTATEFASKFPFDSIYTYVAKKLLDTNLTIETWAICESMLMRSVLSEPSMMTVLVKLFELHGVVDKDGLKSTLEAICAYHAPLAQGYEVAWALWLACTTSTSVGPGIADLIISMEDDLVALVALDLRDRALMDFTSSP